MTGQIRYLVLGLARQVEAWRRERQLPQRCVIAAAINPRVLYGIAGPLTVVRLDTWWDVDPNTSAAVENQIRVLRARGEITQEDRT